MKNLNKATIVATIVVTSTLFLTAASCGSSGTPSANKAQTAQNNAAGSIAAKFNAAVPYPYLNSNPSDPLERKNLSRRLEQYNSKGNTNYVYVFAGMTDKVIGYYVIQGKVSSTASQMTSSQINVKCGEDHGGNDIPCTVDAPGDDGSYGPDEGGSMGVFFFTTNGTLVETDQPFMVSSSPIKIYSSVPQLDAATQ